VTGGCESYAVGVSHVTHTDKVVVKEVGKKGGKK